MEQHLLAYYIGIFIVFASHSYMLINPSQPISTLEQHIYANLIAACLIAYYFTNKEGYINW